MNWTKESQVNEESLQILKGILSKSHLSRTESEKRFIVNTLEEINFFRTYISDSSQRKEAIEEMSQYIKYTYYPKGTLICHQGDYGINFGILAKGHAFVYNAKKKSEYEQDFIKHKKNPELIELYRKYAEAQDFNRNLKKWLHWCRPGGRKVTVLQGEVIAPLLQNSISKNNPALELEKTIKTFVDEVLKRDNKVFSSSGFSKDLSLEDKLLLLHHNGTTRNYFKKGLATFKKVREVQGGDAIAEICLTTDLTMDATIIASEDIHLLIISREHFKTLAESKISNFTEKREFFWKAFPNLTIESVIKLSAYVEERLILNWENVYKEGDEADAVYIVKSGEVQLITVEKEEKVDVYPLPSNIHQKSRKFHAQHKYMIGSIESGGVFGEEEILNHTKRKYTASCNSALTFLYVIKKRIFFDVFEQYFSYISQEFKAALEAKANWRAQRIEHEKKQVEEGRVQTPPLEKQEKFALKTVRIMEETEAEYRHMKTYKPELVVETKTATKVLKFERRKSRISKNNIEIMVLKTKVDEEQEAPKPEHFMRKNSRKNFSVSPDGSLPKTKPSSPVKVQKIKTALFEQNQDFRRWKKYYDAIFPNAKATPKNKQELSISSIPNLKIPAASQVISPVQSSIALAKSWGPKDNIELLLSPKTITMNETLHTENIPSLSIIKSPRPITVSFLETRPRETIGSLQFIRSFSQVPKENGEQELPKVSPTIAQFLKRTLGNNPRRLSIEVDMPKSAGLLTNNPSAATLDEEPQSSQPSLNGLPTKTNHTKSLSSFVRPKTKPKSIIINPQPAEPDVLITQVHTPFMVNRGQESPRMVMINHVSPKGMKRPLTGHEQRNRMSLRIKPF